MTTGSSNTIGKDAMIAGFPSKIPPIDGQITLKELLRVFTHLIACAQSTVTEYNPLNFLFLVVPNSLWTIYSNDPYPASPIHPGTVPPYQPNMTPAQTQFVKDAWGAGKKFHEEDQHMNKALTERFLSLLPGPHKRGYATIMTRNPNQRFEGTFNHFFNEFGLEDELEIEDNRDIMKGKWHPSEGFQILKQRIQDGMTYAAFASKPIGADDALNMMMVVIARTKLFAREYQEWHSHPDVDRTLSNAFTYWAEKVRIMLKYDKLAGSMGRGEEYGMGAGSNTSNSSDQDSEEIIEDYALSMQLSSQNAVLQQQLQQQQLAIGQLQQQAMYAGNSNWNNNQNNNNNNWNNNNSNNGNRKKRGKGNNNNNSWNNNNNTNNNSPKSWKYCWSHGWNKSHDGSGCNNSVMGHQPSAVTHLGTGGNPKLADAMMKSSQKNATRQQQNSRGAPQQQRMPTWQANSGTVQQPPTIATMLPNDPFRGMPPYRPAGPVQQQQFANSGMCYPANLYNGQAQAFSQGNVPMYGNNLGQNF